MSCVSDWSQFRKVVVASRIRRLVPRKLQKELPRKWKATSNQPRTNLVLATQMRLAQVEKTQKTTTIKLHYRRRTSPISAN